MGHQLSPNWITTEHTHQVSLKTESLIHFNKYSSIKNYTKNRNCLNFLDFSSNLSNFPTFRVYTKFPDFSLTGKSFLIFPGFPVRVRTMNLAFCISINPRFATTRHLRPNLLEPKGCRKITGSTIFNTDKVIDAPRKNPLEVTMTSDELTQHQHKVCMPTCQ